MRGQDGRGHEGAPGVRRLSAMRSRGGGTRSAYPQWWRIPGAFRGVGRS
ncbi:hypothetical protein SXIM_04850 [Streptomyces xiamenensis]|uniref:Uncharacterized protein n=1 Tax=Streptomyces xiamenensis TaxID=408015 RepID=A0A0F7FQZ8_9ACTN|nr:hypothetical protein SXIM_04850 [Streptomyces xiamenensis]